MLHREKNVAEDWYLWVVNYETPQVFFSLTKSLLSNLNSIFSKVVFLPGYVCQGRLTTVTNSPQVLGGETRKGFPSSSFWSSTWEGERVDYSTCHFVLEMCHPWGLLFGRQGRRRAQGTTKGDFLATRRGNGVLSSCLVVQQPSLVQLATFSLLLTDQCPSYKGGWLSSTSECQR